MKLEDKLLDRIDVLADKINKISDGAWEALVSYHWLLGLINVILGVLIVIATMLLIIHMFKQHKRVDINNVDNYYTRKRQTYDYFGETRVENEKVPIKRSYMFFNYNDERPSYIKVGDLNKIGLVIMGLLILLIVLSLASIFYIIPENILRMFSPEIFAIKDIIEQLKG